MKRQYCCGNKPMRIVKCERLWHNYRIFTLRCMECGTEYGYVMRDSKRKNGP